MSRSRCPAARRASTASWTWRSPVAATGRCSRICTGRRPCSCSRPCTGTSTCRGCPACTSSRRRAACYKVTGWICPSRSAPVPWRMSRPSRPRRSTRWTRTSPPPHSGSPWRTTPTWNCSRARSSRTGTRGSSPVPGPRWPTAPPCSAPNCCSPAASTTARENSSSSTCTPRPWRRAGRTPPRCSPRSSSPSHGGTPYAGLASWESSTCSRTSPSSPRGGTPTRSSSR